MMFRFTKRMFITLLSFGATFARKCVSLNNQPYQLRPTLIDVKLLMIHLLLVSICLMEVVILLMIHMLEYMFQIN